MTADDAQPARLKHAPSWLTGQLAMHSHRLVTERFTAASRR
jgi:hypothetical protein